MITGVPDHHELNETATGWINLAWDIVISEAANFQDVEHLYAEVEERDGREVAERAINQHWSAKRLRLNNAISLLQQALEIFLKAKIAEVSPFLLISGDPQSWPSNGKSGKVDFAEFRTLDSAHLCRAARIVSSTPLTDKFVQFYTRLRMERNKIIHLNAGSIRAEVSSVIIDILEAHHHLFPDEPWVEFRTKYLNSTGEYWDKEEIFTGDNYTHDKIAREIDAALNNLKPQYAKLYFGYDRRKRGLRCPKCLELRSGGEDQEWEFAQKQADGTIKCIACLSVYTKDEYEKQMIEYFGYLDAAEQAAIAAEVRRDLR